MEFIFFIVFVFFAVKANWYRIAPVLFAKLEQLGLTSPVINRFISQQPSPPRQGRIPMRNTQRVYSLHSSPIARTHSDNLSSHDPAVLPKNIVKRIASQAEGHQPWTSNLSTKDWLLLKSLKLTPLGFVSGVAHYRMATSIKEHIQINQLVYSTSGELKAAGDVFRHACHLALGRLKEEAKLHGAHAVVNVKLNPEFPHSTSHTLECQATGTAIQLDNVPPPDDPVLCATSVIEYAKLMQAGTTPVGVCVGYGLYLDVSDANSAFVANVGSIRQMLTGYEVEHYSNITYRARNLAHQHMMSDIKRYKGNGVLTYDIDFSAEHIDLNDDNNTGRVLRLLLYECLGTVIENSRRHALAKPEFAINLNT